MDKRAFWEKFCGMKSEGYDYSGRKIRYSDYGNRVSLYGWNTEYVKPIIDGGRDASCNIMIANYISIDERCGMFPKWIVNDKKYVAVGTVNNGFTVKEIKMEEES